MSSCSSNSWKSYFELLEKYRGPNNSRITHKPSPQHQYTLELGERSRLEILVGIDLDGRFTFERKNTDSSFSVESGSNGSFVSRLPDQHRHEQQPEDAQYHREADRGCDGTDEILADVERQPRKGCFDT